jgi:glycosyltransferase involved in cell wall biosynthesis
VSTQVEHQPVWQSAGMPRTLVAIPAFNEVDTVGAVVADVRAAVPGAVVLVVDDGSSDGTAQAADRAGALVVTLPFNVGVGGAMRTAFLFAQRHSYDAVVQVDADGQHVATHIPALVEALGESSVVVGSRFSSGQYPVRGPRRWAMRLLATTLTRVCHAPLTDTTSGFRAADRQAIDLFARHYPAEYLGDTVESLVIAARAGLRVREVPVAMRVRQGGTASQSPVRASLYLGRAILALYVALARRPIALPMDTAVARDQAGTTPPDREVG